jgi:plasmid stabilization system protein ParE
MSFKVVILKSAKYDIKQLRNYIVRKFSHETWLMTSEKLQKALRTLETTPLLGAVPEEIEMLNLGPFRQIVSGMNRIIYETRQDVVFIHVIADTRRNMTDLLTQRLLHSSQ